MFAAYELFRDSAGFGFRLRAVNGRAVISARGHASRASALEAIAATRQRSIDKDAYEGRVADDGRRYFVLRARDANVLAASEPFDDTAELTDALWSCVWSGTTVRVRDRTDAQASGARSRNQFVRSSETSTSTF